MKEVVYTATNQRQRRGERRLASLPSVQLFYVFTFSKYLPASLVVQVKESVRYTPVSVCPCPKITSELDDIRPRYLACRFLLKIIQVD